MTQTTLRLDYFTFATELMYENHRIFQARQDQDKAELARLSRLSPPVRLQGNAHSDDAAQVGDSEYGVVK